MNFAENKNDRLDGSGRICIEGEVLSGVETWACRKAVPAVVNQTTLSELQEVISLRGEWEFTTKEVAPLRHPTWRAFYAKEWPESRHIHVPGCWEAQGVGEPGPSQTWDCKWDHGPRELRHVYMGDAWYRKSFDVPVAWRGKRVWLKLGGVRSQGWFWVNSKPVAWVDNYCGTYKYDITDLVEPGTPAVVVAEVNNAIPSRKGLMSFSHRFGGLYRDVEIEATPATRIDYAWVEGDFDAREAEVNALVAFSAEDRRLRDPILRVSVKPVADGDFTETMCSAEIVFADGSRKAEVSLRVKLDPFLPWSPEYPDLYVAEIFLCDGDTPPSMAGQIGLASVKSKCAAKGFS